MREQQDYQETIVICHSRLETKRDNGFAIREQTLWKEIQRENKNGFFHEIDESFHLVDEDVETSEECLGLHQMKSEERFDADALNDGLHSMSISHTIPASAACLTPWQIENMR